MWATVNLVLPHLVCTKNILLQSLSPHILRYPTLAVLFIWSRQSLTILDTDLSSILPSVWYHKGPFPYPVLLCSQRRFRYFPGFTAGQPGLTSPPLRGQFSPRQTIHTLLWAPGWDHHHTEMAVPTAETEHPCYTGSLLSMQLVWNADANKHPVLMISSPLTDRRPPETPGKSLSFSDPEEWPPRPILPSVLELFQRSKNVSG